MRIGYQGIPGSYSETTLTEYVEQNIDNDTLVEAVSYGTFKEVVNDLINEELDFIVVPVENSTTGIIARVTDLIRYQPLVAIAEAYQPVRHSLWGIEGADLTTVRHVYSHPEALGQSERLFEDNPQFYSHAYEDTAKAAAYVKSLNQMDSAAIASPRAGELYGLVPLAENIQNEITNTTRFYVMEKETQKMTFGDKISIYIETKHQSGSLSKVLQVFTIFNCNMLTLNSRPIDNQPFTYGFFLEVNIEHMDLPFEQLIETLRYTAEYVQVVGRFKAGTVNL